MEKRKERGLKQLPDGRWQFSWCVDGRYHRRIANFKGEARAYLEKIHTQIREGWYLDRKKEVRTKFEDAVKRFLEWSEINTRPSTYRNDTYFADRWKAFPRFKGKTLGQISTADVEAYKVARVTEKRGEQTTSKKTVDNDLARLKRLFSLSISWSLCEKNPVLAVKFFKPESRRDRILTPDEEAVLLDKAAPQLKPAIAFSLNTGLRLGEMLSLTWGQVDRRRGEVTITAAKAKGKRSRRVPLNHKAKAALDSLPQAIDPELLVFTHFRGGFNGPFRRLWDKALKDAKLSGVVWHSLRHTFASRLVMAGADLVTIQELLGHTTLAMVLRYAHLAKSHLNQAVALLDSDLQFTCTPAQAPVGAQSMSPAVSS